MYLCFLEPGKRENGLWVAGLAQARQTPDPQRVSRGDLVRVCSYCFELFLQIRGKQKKNILPWPPLCSKTTTSPLARTFRIFKIFFSTVALISNLICWVRLVGKKTSDFSLIFNPSRDCLVTIESGLVFLCFVKDATLSLQNNCMENVKTE